MSLVRRRYCFISNAEKDIFINLKPFNFFFFFKSWRIRPRSQCGFSHCCSCFFAGRWKMCSFRFNFRTFALTKHEHTHAHKQIVAVTTEHTPWHFRSILLWAQKEQFQSNSPCWYPTYLWPLTLREIKPLLHFLPSEKNTSGHWKVKRTDVFEVTTAFLNLSFITG